MTVSGLRMEAGETFEGKNEPDEVLPFALVCEEDVPAAQTLFGLKMNVFTASSSTPSRSHHQATNNLPPALVSSMVSSPSDDGESQTSSMINDYGSDQLLQSTNDRIYPIHPPSVSMTENPGEGSYLPHSCEFGDSSNFLSAVGASSSTHAPTSTSIGFSELMDFADNGNGDLARSRPLPVLQEESSCIIERGGGSTELFTPNSSVDATRNVSNPNWPSTDVLSWLPISSSKYVTLSSLGRSTYEHQREGLLGPRASRLQSSPVEVMQLDHDSFQVAVDIDPQRSLRDVMDILGNPDMLRLWCDPIRSLVVVKSSEGARHNATNHRPYNNRENDREYEGEWIEATIMDLVSPNENLSSMYSAGRALWNCVGFPSYGNVTMFVERPKGRVGLTIGPFVGQVTASHTITVTQATDNSGRLRIIDKVQLRQEYNSNNSNLFFCGVAACVEKCFLPSVDGYMAQMSLSMRRLRILVENGDSMIRHNSETTNSMCCGEGYIAPFLS